jgi:hypothetical protein
MVKQKLIENLLNSQSNSLSTSRNTQLIMMDTARLLMEENDSQNQPKHGGLRPGRLANLPRNFAAGFQQLYRDYFSKSPVYGDYLFRRRFWMHRPLFLRIVKDIEAHDKYFVQKKDALRRPGLHPIQKITSAIRMLAYGAAADANDEYLRIGESTAHESLTRFCDAVISIYGNEYLRHPNKDDAKQILAINEKRGFPGMLGSLDCMHWVWKNCPAAWKGQFQGKEKVSAASTILT